MKTQLSILVKKESLYSRSYGGPLLLPIGGNSVNVVVDGQTYELKASKKPHLIDVMPGVHTVRFLDPRGPKKLARAKFANIMTLNLFKWSGDLAAAVGGDSSTFEVTMQDGDIIKLSCKAIYRGIVKANILKK